MPEQLDDVLLVQKCLKGDKAAFCQLVEKYKVPIYNLAFRMLKSEEEAEDAFQETFLQAYRSLDKYKLNYSFFTWLYTVALNICRNRLKKKWRFQVFSIHEPLGDDENLCWQIADCRLSPDVLLERKNDLDVVNEAINTLPGKYKAVIILRYLENMSYQEISEVVDLPLGTIKTQIHRGRRLIQEYIKKKKGVDDDEEL
jgi:RNA polymerase sigma-70 factor (ECF subfamily)